MYCELRVKFASAKDNTFPLFEDGVTPQNAYYLLAVQ